VTYTENVDTLCELITAECERRMRTGDKLDSREVPECLIAEHREDTILGIADLVNQEMDANDEDRARRILDRNPELQCCAPTLRLVSETLGVPLWHLLTLDGERSIEAGGVAEFIHRLPRTWLPAAP
jgi:hypothetical protein